VCYAYANSCGNRYIHAYTDGIADRDCHLHAYSYSHGYFNADADGYSHSYTNAHAHRDVRRIHDQPDRREHRAGHDRHRQSL
jgi:hypothetical protein